MESERVTAITNWPLPTTVREVSSFLGFAGFYRRFIQRYSKITASLIALTIGKPNDPVDLTPLQREAFVKLKVLFTRAPILRHYDPELPLRIETDASAFAIGAILAQLHGDRWHPIAYMSKKLQGSELRYNIPDAELIAI